MEAYEPYLSLGLALVAGALLGLEREQSAPERNGQQRENIGGIRTYPLFALLGGVSSLLAREYGGWILAVTLIGVIAFLVVGYVHDLKTADDRGLTSEGAFLLAFGLGALALTSEVIKPVSTKVIVVASLAVVATVFLSMKTTLHRFVSKTSKEDVYATLKFLLVAVVVLPLLPNQRYGPLDVLNPFQIGMMVVLIAGISFVGYLAVRLMGPQRGLAITGLVGGLASSTAVTLTFAGRAKQTPELRLPLALGVVLASTLMFARILIEVWIVNRTLLANLWPVMSAMCLSGLAYAGFLFFRSRQKTEGGDVKLHNPFELTSAIKFALIFAAVLLASKAAITYFGHGAIYLTGVLAGLTDVDAITLSMAKLAADGGVSMDVATTTIVLGAAANTAVKAGMSAFIGGWAFGRAILIGFALMLAVGLAVLGVTALA